jgi:crossover junction endodeoxyribonuclease RuvC
VRIFGVDPGSARTGYGCIDLRDSRHEVVICGVLSVPAKISFPDKLKFLHDGLAELLAQHRPDVVAVEDLFYAKNARSALKLGHVRGALLLAAASAGIQIAEYTPTEVKKAVVGFGRAEKHQVRDMVALLLGMTELPSPLDVSDALAVAVCHAHAEGAQSLIKAATPATPGSPRSWRNYRPESQGRRSPR